MNIPDTLRYLKGYLTVKITGLNLERFLNICAAHGINLWDVKRVNMTEIKLNISIRGYRSLKKFIKRTGCRISIVDKFGLPFFLSRIKKRKMLVIGFIVFILLTLTMSSFVWSVEIRGAKTVSSEEIERNLSELGVRPGAFKLNLAVSEIENDMLIRMSNISWIKLKLTGTRAEIEVKERTAPPKEVPEDTPCNIVASRDGIIESIVSGRGDVVVAEGDPVRKGQVLVKGKIERENVEARYVHSTAKVEARTWYEGKAAVPLEKIEKVRTGNKISNFSIILGSKTYKIKNSNISYKSYDKIVRSTKLIQTDSFELPIDIVIEEYCETEDRTVSKTLEEAKIEAVDQVEKQIIDNIGQDAKIINRKINLTVKENIVIVSALIETLEDIGEKEEISIDREDLV